MLDRITLKQLSGQMEIDEFTILREYLQIRFLDQFYRRTGAEKIFFKGGTALKLVFNSSRFSEDLDFTSKISKKKLKKNVQIALKDLRGEFTNLSLKDLKTPKGYSVKLFLPTEIARQELTVKLDFSLTEAYLSTELSSIVSKLPVSPLALVKHLNSEEILAEKIRALWVRNQGRDLFDIWYLLSQGTNLNTKLAQLKLNLYEKTFNLDVLRNKIKNWQEDKLDQDLRKFLPHSERRIIPELKRLTLKQLPA